MHRRSSCKGIGILPAFFNQLIRGYCIECPCFPGYARGAKTRILTQNALPVLSTFLETRLRPVPYFGTNPRL